MRTQIPVSEPHLGEEESKLVLETLQSKWISSLGPNLGAFETQFSAFCGSKYGVTVSNGTTALHLALEALGIGPGDEVIVPDLTFIATANAVVHTGATPVLVDIEPEYLCIDPDAVAKAITPRTKAIIPVHLYGHPADMDRINALAKAHGLFVVEDAAEAHGATWKGKRVGSLGDAGVFSFYGNKIITTGEGGMVTTDDPALREKLCFYRDHAMSKTERYYHPEVGWNYRMTNVQAAIGLAQFGRIDSYIARRKEVFDRYARGLAGVKGIRLNRTAPDAVNVHWLVCLELDDAARRDPLMASLKERGIDSRPYFRPMSSMPMYSGFNCPVARAVSAKGLNLPTSVVLSDEEIDHICSILRDLLR